jgi:hypothetical protein
MRAGDDIEEVLVGRPHAQRWLVGDHGGADIEGGARRFRDPVTFEQDQFLHGLEEEVGV